MQIGLVGLGKMGLNLAQNFKDNNINVTGYDISKEQVQEALDLGIQSTIDMDDFLDGLESPKTVWIMVPSGNATESTVEQLFEKLEEGDTILEAGNSNFNDTLRRSRKAEELGINYLDVGTSGGTSGARNGACIMVGGNEEVFKKYEEVFKKVTVKDGYLYAGKSGAGHYLKMVHNGIEYGMMQAMAEGFQMLEESDFDYNLAKAAKLFDNGSVIRGWLMELMVEAFENDGHLSNFKGMASASGEAKWAVETALDMEVPVPVMALSLMMRNRSLEEDSFAMKVISALRFGFGGHPFVSSEGE